MGIREAHKNQNASAARCLFRRTALTLLLIVFTPGGAFATCAEDWLLVEQRKHGDFADIVVRNLEAHPLTYSLRIFADALDDGRKTLRGTLQAGDERNLLTLPADTMPKFRCSWTIGDSQASHDDDFLYRLPYAEGESYRVLQGFGSRFSHRGIEQYAVDFKMAVGTPVHAARGGVVARAVEEHNRGCWEDGCGKYANFIVIMHDDGTTGEYYHLQQNGVVVEVGETVEAGQHIGFSGNTGHTALPHLHFAVYTATRGARSQSVPINFMSAGGIVYKPRRGHRYLATTVQQAGD